MLEECRSVECYEKLNRISEGTYGVVYRCAAAARHMSC
jgi:cell division cycle 2-like protein